jgi:hypothetical protein
MGKYTIDLKSVSIADYRRLLNSDVKEQTGDDVLAKASGMNLQEISELPYKEYRRLIRAFFKACNEPDVDPEDPNAPN